MATIEEEIEELNQALQKEFAEWDKMEVLAANTVRFDPLQVTSRFNALVKLLIDTGVIKEQELEIRWKRDTLEYLKEARPVIANKVAAAKKQLTVAEAKLFGPNGEIIH